jgi:asparagine synthase (glutamine-hydrolysing)
MGNLTFSHSGLDLLPSLMRRGRLLAAGRAMAALRGQGMAAGEMASTAIGPLLPSGWWRGLQRLRGRPWRQEDFTLASGGDGLEETVRQSASDTVDYAQQPPILDAAARLQVLARFDFGQFNKGILAGWGIDMRDPTADRRLVEYCLRVPAEQFLRHGVRRSLARRMLADRLPAAVVHMQARGLQGADWHEGLTGARGEVEAEAARVSASAAGRLIDRERFQRLVSDWPTDWTSPDAERLYRSVLLRTLSGGFFARKVEGSNA